MIVARCIMFLAGLIISISITSCSKQQTSGIKYVDGLKGPVYIQRDSNGIPHILALKNDNDAYLALGYVHAQDRIWQMDYQRRIAAGRLSEIFGHATLQQDKFLRTWGFYRATTQEWAHLNQQTQTTISSYTAGINALIAEDNFPLQIKVLRYTPERWTNYDSLSWQKMMAFDLQNSWVEKLENLAIAQKHGESGVLNFNPDYPEDGPTILSKQNVSPAHYQNAEINQANRALINPHDLHQIELTLNQSRQVIDSLGFEPFSGKGSNSWVVSGVMTKSGKPLLANDVHLRLSAPTLWYIAEIQGPTLHATGATIPGLPGIIIGHNQHIAWGVSDAYNDAQDLFKIESNTKLATIHEQIKIKDESALDYVVKISAHGPIISNDPAIESLGLNLRLAIQWPAIESDDTTIQSMLQLQKATNWAEFIQSMRDFVSPSQNFIYADTEGNIGYFLPGKLPIRKTFSGAFPVDESATWSGYIPFDELPRVYNPPEGFIVTANNKIVPDDYKYSLASRWNTPPYRAKRIIDLLTMVNHKLDQADFEQFQQDSVSYLWKDLAPILLKTHPLNQHSKDAMAVLAAWDGDCSTDSIGATVFAYWLQQFNTLVPYKPPFGTRALPSYQYLKAILATKTQAKFLSSSLDKAMIKLIKEHGYDEEDWQWGKLHHAYFSELALGQSAFIGWLWERNIATPGGYDTLNVGAYSSKSLKQLYGATYRQVIDMANLDSSSYIYPLGQSENVFSGNYANLLDKWAHGKYITASTANVLCNPQQANCLLLLPK